MTSTAAQRAQWRTAMVDRQLRARGIRSAAVLNAMNTVDRADFVPTYLRERAYDDGPLPIGYGQTISQPYIVALMAEAAGLVGGERVLEIGAGSGYAAAVFSEIADEVFTIERHQALADEAAERLTRAGYGKVTVRCSDGTLGWPEQAPFDAIIVAASGPVVPQALREQLAIGGRLVMPVGRKAHRQVLVRVSRSGADEYVTEQLVRVQFVPLIGEEGWGPAAPPAGEPVTD